MTPEVSDAVEVGADIVLTVGSHEPVPTTADESSVTHVRGIDVEAGPGRTASIEVPNFLRAWRGYDRHQVETFAHQSLALIHALRRRAQRAESRLAALEKQLLAYRHHGQDALIDPSVGAEMATDQHLQNPDEGLAG